VSGWAVRGVDLPFGHEAKSWWVDQIGMRHDKPIVGADPLPGGYVLAGLVDAHSHPAVALGPTGPIALDEQATRTNLIAWAERGITLVRDVGSPGGVTLNLIIAPGQPSVRAAGRFLAPRGRYFPALLMEPVEESELLAAALHELDRGASWVKVIADFPHVPDFTDVAPTYPVELITRLCRAVHAAGGRVAAHTGLPDTGRLVSAGVDSIEHGQGLDAEAVKAMARHGTAWTPTLCAMLEGSARSELSPERRQQAEEIRSRFTELLPLAVRLGVPVLAGTDVVGSLPREVALLAEMGLEPSEALAAASEWPRRFIVGDEVRADIVTYEHDPREDPTQLAHPAAVVVGGQRLR
jgi:imidazolonepropionase-like amidohydrolase